MNRTHPVMLCRECLTNQQFELRHSDSTPRNSHTPASNSTGSWATSEPLRNEQTEAAAGKVHSSFDHTWSNLAFSCWLSVTLYTNCNTNCTCLGPTVWPTDCGDSSSMWFLSFRTCHVHVRGANNTRKCVGTKIDPSSGSNLLAMSRKKVFLNLAGKLQKLTGVTMSDQIFFCEKKLKKHSLSSVFPNLWHLFDSFGLRDCIHRSERCNPGTFQNHGRPPRPPHNTPIKMVCKTCGKINYLIYVVVLSHVTYCDAMILLHYYIFYRCRYLLYYIYICTYYVFRYYTITSPVHKFGKIHVTWQYAILKEDLPWTFHWFFWSGLFP